MNRLIIIGNGFDLAHGLKTRYSDFMLDYLKKAIIKKASTSDEYQLINFKGESHSIRTYKDHLVGQKSMVEISDILMGLNVQLEGKSAFINSILKEIEKKNWVNIEDLFYKQLLMQVTKYSVSDYRKNEAQAFLVMLNSEMKLLEKALIDYLKDIENKVELDFESEDCKEVLRIFKKGASKRSKKNPLSSEITSTLILNFNYTNTAKLYCNELDSEYTIREIPLHGKLSDKESIVFGFGDEVHKSYQEIEDLDENLFFEHIKSFKYLQNENYQDLMAVLESGQFEVFILGHSLGLSDRTMLQAIFNSKYLKKVQLFYYEKDGKNNFVEMTHQLSRHFKDKNRMRTKVVPFSKSEPLPQFPKPQENL